MATHHLKNVRLGDIPIPGKIPVRPKITPSRFSLLSEWIDIEHIDGEILTVHVDIEITKKNRTERITISRSFKATVEKGIFQMTY